MVYIILLLIIGVVFLVISQIPTSVEIAEDDAKIAIAKAQKSKALEARDISEDNRKHTAAVCAAQEAQHHANRAIAQATEVAAKNAAQMGVDLPTYSQLTLGQAQFQAQKELKTHESKLRILEDRAFNDNDIEAGKRLFDIQDRRLAKQVQDQHQLNAKRKKGKK